MLKTAFMLFCFLMVFACFSIKLDSSNCLTKISNVVKNALDLLLCFALKANFLMGRRISLKGAAIRHCVANQTHKKSPVLSRHLQPIRDV